MNDDTVNGDKSKKKKRRWTKEEKRQRIPKKSRNIISNPILSCAEKLSNSNAECNVFTASSVFLSSINTEILISDVEITNMFMFFEAKALNILKATPG